MVDERDGDVAAGSGAGEGDERQRGVPQHRDVAWVMSIVWKFGVTPAGVTPVTVAWMVRAAWWQTAVKALRSAWCLGDYLSDDGCAPGRTPADIDGRSGQVMLATQAAWALAIVPSERRGQALQAGRQPTDWRRDARSTRFRVRNG